MSRRGPLDIAIVGMACRFPGSADLFAYWANILSGVDSISDIPADRWDPAVFYDPNSTSNDRVPCRRGGYLGPSIPFDAASHGIMPNAVEGGEPEQFLVLDAARSALADAGLADGMLNGRRVEVIIGRGNYFNRGNLTRLQHGRIVAQTLAILKSLHPEWSEEEFEAIQLDLKASLPPFGPATVPGQFTNATAGRVSNRLDFSGASYVVDAASASSLVALDLGARSLVTRRADIALVGGVYLEADVDFPLVFRQLGGLSRSGLCKPFAKNADGMVSGEGVGVIVLKRQVDAVHDGDRIYATLRGVGIASDGRGLGLASPSARGHARAMRRAYRSSGIDPATIGLVEGHGLGVPAADRAEIRALRAIFPSTRRGRRSLGAVSSMIGHAMPAAGIAGLIKAALALHHRVLPPTLHADEPHPWLDRDDSPCHLNRAARPWVNGDTENPRRAGVNAFGFAGINAHAILEEHSPSSDSDSAQGALLSWDSEAILLTAADRPSLIARVRFLLGWLEAGAEVCLKDLAFTLNTAEVEGPSRLGLVAKSLPDLVERLQAALEKLLDPSCRSIRDARGAYFWERGENSTSKLAFLFPGEGSQYPGMLADLCPHFPEVRALFDISDRIARQSGATIWPSEHLFDPASGQDPALWSAEVGVNVVLSAQWGLYQLLSKLGLRADAIVGHSSGELLALAAAGVLKVDRTFEDKLGELGFIFGRLETSGELPTARLVAVAAAREKVEAAFLGSDVEVAMDNCPHQVVIAGRPGEVEAVVGRLKESGIVCENLPFARAYHTPGFAPAIEPIARFFDSLPMSSPLIPIYSCATETRMPDDPAEIRQLAIDQWTRAVGFRRTLEAMHADGVDVLVDVGARGNLAGFVEDTLRGRPVLAIAANLPRRSGTIQLNHLVASLFARGVAIKPDHLYARRRPSQIDLESPPASLPAIPDLAVGFPTMTLSDALVERLRNRGIHSRADNGHDPKVLISFPDEKETASETSWPGQVAWSDLSHNVRNGTGHHGSNGHSVVVDEFPISHQPRMEETDATVLDFQESMAAFLRTQEEVMAAFFNAGSIVEDEFAFHLPNEVEPSSTRVGGPWAGELISLVEGREAVAILKLDLIGDPVAEHHTLGGRKISSVHREWRGLPVLPFAVMAEMLAQAAARLVPGKPLLTLRDVRAHRWIRYEDEPIALEIRAYVDPEAPGTIKVAIHNRGPLRAMGPLESPVFEGVVAFGKMMLPSPRARPFSVANAVACRFTPESIYGEQWLFHGPALQAVVGIGPVSMDGIEGTLRVLPFEPLLRVGDDASALLTDPIILDNFTHLLGGWGLDRLADNGDVIFPLRMGELALFGSSPAIGTDVSCRISIREIERHRVLVDADIVRTDGSLWMTIRGWEDWRFHWPDRFRDGFRQPELTFLGEQLEIHGHEHLATAVWIEPPGDMGRAVWRDVLEHVQLGPDERADYLALGGPDHRRTHRLWGRIAAKEAARRLRLDRGHPPEYPADLIVERDPLGRPGLRSRVDPGCKDLPSLSIAHVDGVAVALACVDPAGRPGIDVEPIVERSSTFESTAFLPGERALLGDRTGETRAEGVARLWCSKEAVAKATGQGFVDGPSGVEVVFEGSDGSFGVMLRGDLASACPGLAGRTIRVVTTRRGDFVWAWTLGQGMKS